MFLSRAQGGPLSRQGPARFQPALIISRLCLSCGGCHSSRRIFQPGGPALARALQESIRPPPAACSCDTGAVGARPWQGCRIILGLGSLRRGRTVGAAIRGSAARLRFNRWSRGHGALRPEATGPSVSRRARHRRGFPHPLLFLSSPSLARVAPSPSAVGGTPAGTGRAAGFLSPWALQTQAGR